jgi:hypothetical protein
MVAYHPITEMAIMTPIDQAIQMRGRDSLEMVTSFLIVGCLVRFLLECWVCLLFLE